MPVARPEPSETRVIAHVDLDCFYVQVEQRKRPELRGKPTGVVQYNPWKGGGLIAVGYEARRFGVTRNMRGDEAKKVCPGIELVQVPTAHGKADLTQYRDAGSEVVSVLSRKGTCERASIDEVYLDITEASAALSLHEPFSEEVLNSHILGYSEGAKEQNSIVRQWLLRSEADPKDRMLATGAVVIAELRMAVLEETGFTCSAGVAHNKMLAKLASGMHKPAQQTLVPWSSVSKLLATLPIKKMKQLGGKLGDSLQADLHISFVGDLLQFSELKLQDLYGVNTGTWLWNVARGMSGDEVKARTLPKSHSCGKTFPGPKALKSLEDVEHWMTELAAELQERLDVDLEQNHRMAHLLTVHAGTNHGYKVNQDRKFPSKSCVLRYGKEKIAQDAVRLFERGLNDYLTPYNVSPQKKGGTSFSAWAITSLFIGASNMWATPAGMNPITRFFLSPTSPSTSSLQGVGPISPLASPSKSFSLDEPLQGVGPISPLASPSKSFSLDEPLSPREKPSSDDETMVKACKIKYDFDTKGVGMCSESNSSMHPAKVEQSEQLMENLATARLLYDSSCIPRKGIGDAHGRGGDEQTSDARLGNHGKMPMDASDSVGESEVICTPTFGNFGHVNAMQCMLQLPASGSGISDVDLECSNSNPLRMDPIESSSQAPHLVIHCSPVEQEAVATYEVKDTVGSENLSLLQRMKAPQLSEIINTVGSENPSLLQRTKEPQRSCTAVASRQQPSGFLKLKDVWDRKGSSASQCIRSESSVETTAWGYKQGEIDEAVLSELPEEIQEELYRSFGFKRQRMVKRSTIGDFFKGSSAHGSNKSNI